MKDLIFRSAVLITCFFTAGCQGVPGDILKSPSDVNARREIESKVFSNVREEKIYTVCLNVLQDLGFNLENSEIKLGVITASKERDAYETLQVTKLALVKITTFGVGDIAINKDQTIRATVVIRPLFEEQEKNISKASNSILKSKHQNTDFSVRLTLQRIVRKSDRTNIVESIKDKEIFQEFFYKISQSIFLEDKR